MINSVTLDGSKAVLEVSPIQEVHRLSTKTPISRTAMGLVKSVAACATERIVCTRNFTNKGHGRLQIRLKAFLSKSPCQGSQKPVPAELIQLALN